MSYLDLPRICFGGTWTGNVATGNNQPYVYWKQDGETQQALLLDFGNVGVNAITVNGSTPSDAQLRQMMNDEDIKDGAGSAPDGGANWCYWGMNSAGFDTAVTAVSLNGTSTTDDILVGKPAAYQNGELCDSNPSGAQATQVFTSGFNLAGVTLATNRTFSRWVWFYRNGQVSGSAGASGVFEGVLTVTADQWTQLLATGSAAIQALHAAYVAAGDAAVGLSVRYGLYLTLSEPDPGATINRIGLVSGAIGVATSNELASFPNCRALYDLTGERRQRGPTFLHVDRARHLISVDLFSSLFEAGNTYDTVHKSDTAPFQLQLISATRNSVPYLVGTITPEQYGIVNTKTQGSIVDLDCSANWGDIENLLDQGDTFILGPSDTSSVLTENFWAATDERNYYLQNGEAGSIQIKVMNKEQPLANQTVYLQQCIVDYAGDDSDVGGEPVTDQNLWLVTMPETVTTDANGYATINLTGKGNGNAVIRFTLTPDTDAVDVLVDGFANIRVLPTDDYSGITDQQLLGQAGFDFIFQNVMRFFYLTYPVMQPIMDFSNYNVMTNSRMLLMLQTVTDPESWWQPGYMPRTRDLSASRRALLARWATLNYAALYGTPSA